jgi:hypothetical protein
MKPPNIRMPKGPMSPEAKAALMEKLRAGKAKHAELRKADPNHKPRKPRKKKNIDKNDDKAIDNPLASKPANETIAPIDSAPAGAVNKVAAKPTDPVPTMSAKIDVPNLPEESKKKKIVKKPLAEPERAPEKGLSSTGKPEKYNDTNLIRDEETGNQAIEAMLPGQKESIKKLLRKNKKENDPLAPKPVPAPATKTVSNVKEHIPDMKAVEAKKPFSFSVVRQLLYQ